MEDLQICRTCGSGENLFKISEQQNLQDLIIKHLEIGWHPLLSFICDNCFNWVNEFNKFKQNAQVFDQVLREALFKTEKPLRVILLSNQQNPEKSAASTLDCNANYVLNTSLNAVENVNLAPVSSNETNACQEPEPVTNYNETNLANKSEAEAKPCQNDYSEKYEIIPSSSNEKDGILCTICLRKFSKLGPWKRHFNRSHLKAPQLFECHFCQRNFFAKNPLRRHLLQHVEDPLICFKCGAKFNSKYSLKVHLQRHSNNFPFTCDNCSNAYKSAQELKNHKISHTQEKKFTCTVCGNTFTSYNGFKRHDEKHRGMVKQVPCPTCNKTFQSQSALRMHLRMHTDQRPFKCGTCLLTFRQKATLQKHIYAHSGIRPFNCTFAGCVKGFYCPADLRRHHKKEHNCLDQSRIEKRGIDWDLSRV